MISNHHRAEIGQKWSPLRCLVDSTFTWQNYFLRHDVWSTSARHWSGLRTIIAVCRPNPHMTRSQHTLRATHIDAIKHGVSFKTPLKSHENLPAFFICPRSRKTPAEFQETAHQHISQHYFYNYFNHFLWDHQNKHYRRNYSLYLINLQTAPLS